MKKVPLRKVKRGEWFAKKPLDTPAENQVWVRGEFDRSSGKISCYAWADVCKEQFINPSKEVYVDFIF